MIEHLEISQRSDGSFPSVSSRDPRFADSETTRQTTTLYTASILIALSAIGGDARLASIREGGAAYLLKQKSACWSYNYWQRGSVGAEQHPYPDDLDDTCLAMSALANCDPKLIGGEALANLVALLTFAEETEGGPYRTWLISAQAPRIWKDIDLAVNSNIAYCLGLQNVILPNLTAFQERAIRKRSFASPYYASIYPVLYFLARSYRGDLRDQLRSFIINCQDERGVWDNPLSTALMTTSLLRLGGAMDAVERATSALAGLRRPEIIKPYPFVVERTDAQGTVFSGSASQTVACYLEAMNLYKQEERYRQNGTLTSVPTKEQRPAADQKLVLAIRRQTLERIKMLHSPFREQTEKIINTAVSKDTEGLRTLVPYYMASALEHRRVVLAETVIMLGQAHLYGWLAYTIYDNILDEEDDGKGGRAALPLANLFLRESVTIFQKFCRKYRPFGELFRETMDRLEETQHWEIQHCRARRTDLTDGNGATAGRTALTISTLPDFGNYDRLAERSGGHWLGALAILPALGYGLESKTARQLTSFFKHYLIARQLNDDLHDWEEDLTAGRISSAVAMLISSWRPNATGEITIDLKKDLDDLRQLFWAAILEKGARLIEEHLGAAEQAAAALPLRNGATFFTDSLAPLRGAVNKARDERTKITEFLAAYDKKTQN